MDSLFVPALEPTLKHATVFKKFDALASGDSFLLVNDHDPIPLFYEMKAERGDVFEWKKLENGPEVWKVEIKKTANGTKTENTPGLKAEEEDVFVLNVTLLEPRLKHPTIFQVFDQLAAGEAFQILNDHDPKPLYYQMLGERGNVFTWDYLESGPKWWRVQIRKNNAGEAETVGAIAAKDMRKAEVFKKYGIDFCCGGKKTLSEACAEKGLDVDLVEAELENARGNTKTENNFNRWEPDFLADYIYNQHHLYYYAEAPITGDLLVKVLNHHGDRYPFLQQVYALYARLVQELNAHFIKEERVVFPFIKALVAAKRTGDFSQLNSQPSLTEPVHMMESEHEMAGEILDALQKLTHNYTPPADACNSFRFLYKRLSELDEDLHQHIHLENNLLFPKALDLEKQLRQA
jgi:regulator of cell morphogenesis and NO signaling